MCKQLTLLCVFFSVALAVEGQALAPTAQLAAVGKPNDAASGRTVLAAVNAKNKTAFAQPVRVRNIDDDSLLRATLVKDWFNETPDSVLARPALVTRLAGGETEAVFARKDGAKSIAIYGLRLAAGEKPPAGVPRSVRSGSWTLWRDSKTGVKTKWRFYPRNDPRVYLEFRPVVYDYSPEQNANAKGRIDTRDKCFVDMVVYGAYIKESVPLPLSLDDLLVTPVRTIADLCAQRLPLHYFEPFPADFAVIQSLIQKIRAKLPSLHYETDGAINQAGDYVKIATLWIVEPDQAGLNCSGFVKYLTDGVLMPETGTRLPIPPLKAPFGKRGDAFTNTYETSRDPFFGLDWIRNLASQANRILRGSLFGGLNEIEVQNAPFSSMKVVTKNGRELRRSIPDFMPQAGFEIAALAPLLYTLACDEAGEFFYLGACNTLVRPSPRVRQFFHTVAFFPYFDRTGAFHIACFESAAESPIRRFLARHKGQEISLVRVPAGNGQFYENTIME